MSDFGWIMLVVIVLIVVNGVIEIAGGRDDKE